MNELYHASNYYLNKHKKIEGFTIRVIYIDEYVDTDAYNIFYTYTAVVSTKKKEPATDSYKSTGRTWYTPFTKYCCVDKKHLTNIINKLKLNKKIKKLH